MESKKPKSPKIYSLSMGYKDELDGLKKLVQLFSYQWKIQGKVPNVLRNKLVVLLALYLKHGFSRETKRMAMETLGVNMSSINSMNLELRQGSYLVKDKMNTRINHLHSDLTLLKNYIEDLDKEESTPLVLFCLIQDNA